MNERSKKLYFVPKNNICSYALAPKSHCLLFLILWVQGQGVAFCVPVSVSVPYHNVLQPLQEINGKVGKEKATYPISTVKLYEGNAYLRLQSEKGTPTISCKITSEEKKEKKHKKKRDREGGGKERERKKHKRHHHKDKDKEKEKDKEKGKRKHANGHYPLPPIVDPSKRHRDKVFSFSFSFLIVPLCHAWNVLIWQTFIYNQHIDSYGLAGRFHIYTDKTYCSNFSYLGFKIILRLERQVSN